MSRSLYIRREVGERSEEARILSEIGSLLQNNKQPELAILFYKQSVNVIEGIRKNLENLSEDDRKAYTTAVASNYRILADLLIKQDRILEAQQVLDLLKVQELSDYFRSETVGNNAKKADYQLPEQNIIALGIELDQLQKLNPLTIEQKQRIAYLTSQEIDRNAQFNTFLNSLPVQKQIEQLRRDKAKNVDLEEYNRLREILKEIKNAVIFYPLILDDRLELILITDSNTPIRKTTYIKREDLNKDISDFLISLRNPSSNAVQADAQKFYRYLIEPFEKELQDAKIETIIYAPDGQLRYIPLAALYDGKQWLVERYRINNITASSLTNLRPRPRKPLRVLAAAATTSQNIKFGDTSIPFVALPATRTEVEAISALIPTTVTLFDQQFNKIDTLPKMQSNSIVHLATHGYFAIGKPEDSFIVFGDGDKATIADMKNWTLTNVELVVLSACETAIGSKVGSGIEIFGLGYQIHNAGAGAAIASLWKVSDGGTQKLMDAFYTALKTGKVSNIEALQQAQVAMITGNSEGLGEPRGQVSVEMRSRNTSIVLPKISHPYYWAAFILIGNGL
jgi:CHAT domain-containing protein